MTERSSDTDARRPAMTFIRCSIDETVGLVTCGPDFLCDQDTQRDEEEARDQWIADAAARCRCSLFWVPCEGVLAGGPCDELSEDDDDGWG